MENTYERTYYTSRTHRGKNHVYQFVTLNGEIVSRAPACRCPGTCNGNTQAYMSKLYPVDFTKPMPGNLCKGGAAVLAAVVEKQA